MKFLTKIGSVLLKVTQIVSGVAPLFPQYDKVTGKVVDTLSNVANVIVTVETFGQVLSTPGADKLKAATPLVAQAILQSDLMVGRKINDSVLFETGARKIADGMADILNSLKDKVDTEDLA